MQCIKLVDYGDNIIMMSLRDNYFSTNFEMTSDEGLMLAFGITTYDDEDYEQVDEPDYGELKAYYKTWGLKDAQGVEFTEIPTTQCTKE